ncbi:translation initiation factor IF-3, mitochondrial [Phascolarctos cinereus]|uniref:Translation initiation factor IF-3, mitochondrial n=1 Tax=Phascolarctos cinereus TaxID=38626 RepID=A0A6P5L3Z1_PHACI|nr:translation initiation factor IF-3, mitochondrial [Phascolarctos cinereus]XP_020852794.1 translation initiation factor IF-3, mitochondrial [Phascolarctos cinereus]XP_020852795.1 translation initiation factor IF-3, mitochondrial [Phascolarctos cinereus]
MTALMRKFIHQTVKTRINCSDRYFSPQIVQKRALTQFGVITVAKRLPLPTYANAFSTVGNTEDETNKKKTSKSAFGNVGRKIHHRVLQLLDSNGNNLGMMHRMNVIRLMEEQNLRLVLRNANADPPVYQLMSGRQIHEEQLRLREKEKTQAKTGPPQLKESIFSSNIAQHDLDIKIKQIQQWIQKKYQVQITVKKGKTTDPADNMEELFNKILKTMPELATFTSKPQIIRGGKAATCVFRHLSNKEMATYRKSTETQKSRDTLNKENSYDTESDILQQ